jgi:hypothetical protein
MISRALLGISGRSVAAAPTSAMMCWEEQPLFELISRALLGISGRSVAAAPTSAMMWWEEQPSFPELY